MIIKNSVIEILKRNGVEWKNSYDCLELVNVGVDSLLFVKLIVEIEEEYGFEFKDEDLNAGMYRTMNDFLYKIRDYLNKDISN